MKTEQKDLMNKCLKMTNLNKDEKNLQSVIDALNKKGFILEDRTFKIILKYVPSYEITLNKPLVDSKRGERKEIDLLIRFLNKLLVIECKRTIFSWFFPRNTTKNGRVGFITNSNTRIFTKCRDTSFKAVRSGFALGLNEEGSYTKNSSPNDVNDAIYQLMCNIQLFLNELDTLSDKFMNKELIPIIVTNANLFIIDYCYEDLNENGDLNENHREISPEPYVAFNFPMILKWNETQTVGFSGVRNSEESEHLKTIFIVNVEKLDEFICLLSSGDFDKI